MSSPAPETPPDLPGPSPTSYPISQTVLGNGLRVIASPDHGAPSVAVNLWYDVGSRHEQPGRTGFAHLFEHIMFQGSANVAAGQHIGLMQAAGAMVNATTSMDRTNYFETLPTGGADLALWLEADRLGTLLDALTQENLDTQREVVKEEKRQRYDNVPYGDAMQRLIELTFPADHPYGHTTIGSMDDLNAATVDDVRAFFATHYLPNNAVLTIAGDLDPEDAFERAQRYFGDLAAGPAPADPDPTPLPVITGLPQAETTAVVPAEAIYLTWRLPTRDTPEFDAADLALSVLGHGQTSRLHRALVRGAELAESAAAMTMPLIGGTSIGICYARARSGVTPERLTEALLAEVHRLRNDGPTEIEVRRAKAQFERHWLNELARIDSRADTIGEYATLHGDPTMINSRLATFTAIDQDQIEAALTDRLDPDHRATLIYRKESA
ncbi:M16 family metallopeptidase [Microlunatus parietis]|uniref:Putative Zn-dependent peptidase n=1 Tax=Microlunatus parietis TaxID=682979 RepID=A0A7Y9LER3_9ACTN|nr:pitrilysin family protein [Microlunatus parietis]NYE75287.1 putative Zn-dependent peptidase [Microlunatus parietis]